MAELEIHHESGNEDRQGKHIGVLAALIAVGLAVVTILSHRAHTDAVVHKTEANDQWAFYQAKSLKGHSLALGRDLLISLGANSEQSRTMLARYAEEQKRYDRECEEIKHEAQVLDTDSKLAERRALRYDIGEGLLEIGLVLSSLFFIARRRMFPVIGSIAALLGAGVAVSTYFIH